MTAHTAETTTATVLTAAWQVKNASLYTHQFLVWAAQVAMRTVKKAKVIDVSFGYKGVNVVHEAQLCQSKVADLRVKTELYQRAVVRAGSARQNNDERFLLATIDGMEIRLFFGDAQAPWDMSAEPKCQKWVLERDDFEYGNYDRDEFDTYAEALTAFADMVAHHEPAYPQQSWTYGRMVRELKGKYILSSNPVGKDQTYCLYESKGLYYQVWKNRFTQEVQEIKVYETSISKKPRNGKKLKIG